MRGRTGKAYFDETLALRDELRSAFAGLVGVERERVALTTSTTDGDVVVIAGDFNVLDPALEAYAGTRDGIDQVLVRGARLESVVAWSREQRVQDGVVLSDHPVVEARIETEHS